MDMRRTIYGHVKWTSRVGDPVWTPFFVHYPTELHFDNSLPQQNGAPSSKSRIWQKANWVAKEVEVGWPRSTRERISPTLRHTHLKFPLNVVIVVFGSNLLFGTNLKSAWCFTEFGLSIPWTTFLYFPPRLTARFVKSSSLVPSRHASLSMLQRVSLPTTNPLCGAACCCVFHYAGPNSAPPISSHSNFRRLDRDFPNTLSLLGFKSYVPYPTFDCLTFVSGPFFGVPKPWHHNPHVLVRDERMNKSTEPFEKFVLSALCTPSS